jgi:hypothetical protein
LECLSSKYEYNEEQFNIQNAVNFIWTEALNIILTLSNLFYLELTCK